MPTVRCQWLPRSEILRFHELARLVGAFVDLGVERVRITGGEPLLRRGLEALVTAIAETAGVRDLALTTNGVLLAGQARALRAAGLGRVTVSLDTLDRERFSSLTGADRLADVLAGIDAAVAAGLRPLKLDAVVMRGLNERELAGLLEFAWSRDAELRFIEYMKIGESSAWRPELVVPATEMLSIIAARYGEPHPVPDREAAPARRFALADGRRFGIVAGHSTPFCRRCDRSRVTADGTWYPCLHAVSGVDLKAALRSGLDREALVERIRAAWAARRDLGAEHALPPPHAPNATLADEAHRQMHTRGG